MESLHIIAEGTAATVVLWFVSALMAILAALVLALGLIGGNRGIRAAAILFTNISRGIPTSLYVLAAGFISMGWVAWAGVPSLFPGTPAPFQVVALGVCIALAFGSAGHIAKILEASWRTMPTNSREQLRVLCLTPGERAGLVARECAQTALPPLSARLVHHLHNTAFAALFPISDLFGAVQGYATTSARVFFYVTVGACVYVALSSLIWLGLRMIESALAPAGRIRLMRAAA